MPPSYRDKAPDEFPYPAKVERIHAVSPRPSPTRHDATAMIYLNAASTLIDASLMPDSAGIPPRLRALHYPAALDWIRIEDVLRLAQDDGHSVSKRALMNRWPTKDDFIRDAIVHALLYRDDPGGDPVGLVPTLDFILEADSFSESVSTVADGLVELLQSHPRSFLLAHIAPLLPRHGQLAEDIRRSSVAAQQQWSDHYRVLQRVMGVKLRPDWTVERLTLAIQLVLDGIMIRSRIEPDIMAPGRWASGSIYADTVLAIISAVIDTEGDGRSMRTWIDDRVKAAPRRMVG